MSNVLFIIVDSLSYDRMHNSNQSVSLTPFLDSIKDKCITAENLYSQGPFTEAGTKGLLCCCNTLDNGGYFLRYDTQEKFITDIFKDMDYETYNVNAPSYLLSRRTLKNIDHMIYTTGLDCRFLWSQRFSFYYDRWISGDLNCEDYNYLSRFVDLVLESLEDLFSSDNEEEKYSIIQNLISEDIIDQNRLTLQQERARFTADPNAYVDSVFRLRMEHPIFTIKNIDRPKMIKTAAVNRALDRHKTLVRKIRRIQFFRNIRNNHCTRGIAARTVKSIFHRGVCGKRCGELLNWIRTVVSGREIEVYRSGFYYTKDPYKFVPSSKTQLEYAASLINNDDGRDKFVFLHTEEPHYFNTFFSYDRDDDALLDRELSEAEEYLDSLDGRYKGSVYYDLSVRYIDKQIENLYHELETSGRLKDTLVVITADHGSSYFFDPIRSALINNFHSENYHIPLYIFGANVEGKQYEKLCLGKDLIPTVAQLCGRKLAGNFSGHSIMDEGYQEDSVLLEYMGPGCPDIRVRPVWLSARSRRYVVSFIEALKEPFSEENIVEIYNLTADPRERFNIRAERNPEIQELIEKIRSRFLELRAEQGFNN